MRLILIMAVLAIAAVTVFAEPNFLEGYIQSEQGIDGAVTVVEYGLDEKDPDFGYATVEIPYRDIEGNPKNGQGRLYIRRQDLESGKPVPPLCHVHYEKDLGGAKHWCERGWAVATSHYGSRDNGEYPLELCIGDSNNLSRALIEWVRRLPFIDRAHLHIDGGSAGGYMALAMSADMFPVCATTADVPVCNWAYNLNYFDANRPVSGYPMSGVEGAEALKKSPLPIVYIVSVLIEQSMDVFGKDLSADAYYLVSPIAYLDRIANPVMIQCATGDMLVPIDQMFRNVEHPFDPAEFPEGYVRDFDKLTLCKKARVRVDECIPKERLNVVKMPLQEGMHEIKLAYFLKEEEEPPPPPELNRPWDEDKQWNVVVLDEGSPKPYSPHSRYKWNTTPYGFAEAYQKATPDPSILNGPKLERLLQRYVGKLDGMATLAKTGEPMNRLNFAALERRDVVQGLLDYANLGAGHAQRLVELYAKASIKPFGDTLSIDGLRDELKSLQAAQAGLDASFFEHCAFVSIDLQEGTRPKPLTYDQIPALWREMGFTAEDVNAANDFAWDVALPNAVKVADACRGLGLPMVFIHWGYRFKNGMDLDPDIRQSMLKEHGTDYDKWSGFIGQPGSQPAKVFGICDSDYVIAKTGQDAFSSSSIDFVLRNLGVTNLVFVGGHTGACLGKSAKSAKEHGYATLCIRDATNNARESTREKEIRDTGYDYVITTAEFLELAQSQTKLRKPS